MERMLFKSKKVFVIFNVFHGQMYLFQASKYTYEPPKYTYDK